MPPASSESRSRRDSSRSARACPISPPAIGAIATQALVNPYYGIDGLKLLREGRGPREIVESLIAGRRGRASRQVHVMDAGGRDRRLYRAANASTGAGTSRATGFSIAGNMLAGARVLDDTAKAYIAERKAAIRATADRRDATRAKPPAATSAAGNRRHF